MNKLPFLAILVALVVAVLPACNNDSDNSWSEKYEEWRETNEKWLIEQQARTNPDGTPYFKTIVPVWSDQSYVLIHYFGDPKLNEGNLTPLSTSTIDTRYRGFYCNGTPLDSSLNINTYGPGVFRTQLNKVITGWTIAFETMHVGDSAEIVIPYQSAYGATVSTTSSVPPYSNLTFFVRLVDIPYYEANPK